MPVTLCDPEELARTYNHPSVADAYELVEQYHEVMEYAAKHPKRGSSAIANRLDLPRGRIRPWLDNENPARPDPVRAIQQAESLGWINVPTASDQAKGLMMLVAWVFSGGSITEQTYVPHFTVDADRDVERLSAVADLVGIELKKNDRRDQGQGREFKPAEYASLLGRVLASLDAPVGEKTSDADIHLPEFLDVVENDRRVAFAATYILNRGTRGERPSRFLTMRENRSGMYLDRLAAFLADVSSEGKVGRSEKNVFLDGNAAGSILHQFQKR